MMLADEIALLHQQLILDRNGVVFIDHTSHGHAVTTKETGTDMKHEYR
jgi:hypothetical protein